MAKAPRFTRLTGSAGLWPARKPGFASLAQQSLGNAGSPADGTDGQIAGILGALSGVGSLLDAITAAGAALQAADTATNAVKLPNLDASITAATQASDAQLKTLGAALGLLAAGGLTPAMLGPAPTPPTEAVDCASSGTSGGNTGYLTGAEDAGKATALANSLLGGMVSTGLITAGTAASVALMITVIGAAAAVALLLVYFFGHGCGQACIDASKAEQIYEASADNLAAVFHAGMISLAQAVAGMVHLLAAGQQHMATFNTQQARNGSANMTKVITAEIQGVQHDPKPKPVPFSLDKARLDYIYTGNWYPDALGAASQLTDEYLKALTAQKGA